MRERFEADPEADGFGDGERAGILNHAAWIGSVPAARVRDEFLRRLARGEYAHYDADGWVRLLAHLDAIPIYG